MSETGGEDNLPVRLSREELILNCKMRGMSTVDIAQELQISTVDVSNCVRRQLGRDAEYRTDEEREDMLALENARLDYYLTRLWPSIEMGDIASIKEARAITHERIALNQLQMPSSTATTQVLVVGGESVSYIEKLKELADG